MKQPYEAFLLYMVYDEAIHGPVTDGEGCTVSRQECIDNQGWYWALVEIPRSNCRYSDQLPMPDKRVHPCSHCTKGRNVLMEENPVPEWMSYVRESSPIEGIKAGKKWMRWYLWRKQNGLCVSCGKINNTEKVKCPECLEKQRAYNNARNAEKRLKSNHVDTQ